MKKIFRGLSIGFALLVCLVSVAGFNISKNLPNNFDAYTNNSVNLNSDLPLSLKNSKTKGYLEVSSIQKVSNINANNGQLQLQLFNLIPIKNVNLNIVSERYVIPCGTPFGIKIFTDGVLIVGASEVNGENEKCNPAKDAGLEVGNVILTINGEKITTNEQISQIVKNSNGQVLEIESKNSEEEFKTYLLPVKSADDGSYKAGIWVRDSTAGIGTLTYYDQEKGVFGGLGHGVCDVDTAQIMPISKGDIVGASISGVKKGEVGAPGELHGHFNSKNALGTLIRNQEQGVYGEMASSPVNNEKIKLGLKQEVKKGNAKILTTVEGETPKYYNIEIESINYNSKSPSKNMIIKITDPELIQITGGIVQGMSGTPIIQDDKLIGAVTHVFVNDPQKGYAIFADNMIEISDSVK